MSPVTTKQQMYDLLRAGAFGNTVPQWMSVAEWAADPAAAGWPSWGVRSLTPGGPCAFYVPSGKVPSVAAAAGGRVNLSPMVDAVAGITAWLEVWESPTGLVVEGVEYPDIPRETWRTAMPDPARRRSWAGLAAYMVLARHLNPNSKADLWDVLGAYPGHVVELSALDRCLGTVEHRNAVVWEVRSY